VVLVAGILILLFIPYLLWGTGLMTARSQAHLRSEFSTALHHSQGAAVKRPASPPKGTTAPALQVAPHMADPPVGSAVAQLTIPKIGLSMVVVEGTGDAQLQQGPGHYTNTPLPGEIGNVAIAGHRTTYLHPFYNLNELVPGDPITIVTVQGIFLYRVTGSLAVAPTDVSVVDATAGPTLTLTTCNPRYSASQRLVVHAALVASALSHAKVAPVPTKPSHSHVVPESATPAHDWAAAIIWGVIVAALTIALWVGFLRVRRGQRAAVTVAGGIGWLVVVFFFFQAVAPLLPASY
jgi:sortase A